MGRSTEMPRPEYRAQNTVPRISRPEYRAQAEVRLAQILGQSRAQKQNPMLHLTRNLNAHRRMAKETAAKFSDDLVSIMPGVARS